MHIDGANRYHEDLEERLRPSGVRLICPKPTVGVAFDPTLELVYRDFRFQVACDATEKDECLRYADKIRPQHGFTGEEAAEETSKNSRSPQHVYVSARDNFPMNPQLRGVFRIRYDYDLRSFDNLTNDMNEKRENCRFADISAYHTEKAGKQAVVFHGMFVVCARLLSSIGVPYVYIQLRDGDDPQRSFFESIGFKAASVGKFKAAGWDNEWRAFYMDLPQVMKNWNDETFRDAWHDKVGTRFNVQFWKEVSPMLRGSAGN